MKQVNPFTAIQQSHREVKQIEHNRMQRNGFTIVLCAVLLIEFILLRLLGA